MQNRRSSFQSKDCQLTNSQSLSLVSCPTDGVSEFTIENDQGQPVTFAVFPKSMARHAWLLNIKEKKHLLFSDSTILSNPDGFEAYNVGANTFTFAVYPALPDTPRHQTTLLSLASAPHDSMSAYTLSFPDAEPFVHAKIVDRRTLTLSTDKPTLPDDINNVFLDIDYTGDLGLAFINGELVDDHFYFGKPWHMGLKRFLGRLAEEGMYISFRPLFKDAPFLADLPSAAVPDFTVEPKVLRMRSSARAARIHHIGELLTRIEL